MNPLSRSSVVHCHIDPGTTQGLLIGDAEVLEPGFCFPSEGSDFYLLEVAENCL